MAVTRSGRSTGTKIKFLEDGEFPSGADVLSVSTRESTREPEVQEVDDESSDSDDAPEEESTSNARQATLDRQKEQDKVEQELRRQEREKRKQRDLHFKQQQEEKRERTKELVAAEELPDLLPDDILQSADDESDTTISMGKHLRAEDLEKEHAEARKRMKLEKLKQLKAHRQSAIRKGPVHVQVQSFGSSTKRVPAAEQGIMESKNSWMQRASLNRK